MSVGWLVRMLIIGWSIIHLFDDPHGAPKTSVKSVHVHISQKYQIADSPILSIITKFLNRVTENMVIFESGLPRRRNDTISITDDNPKICWQSNEVYSWPQPPLISYGKCTGRILASAASYLL